MPGTANLVKSPMAEKARVALLNIHIVKQLSKYSFIFIVSAALSLFWRNLLQWDVVNAKTHNYSVPRSDGIVLAQNETVVLLIPTLMECRQNGIGKNLKAKE